MFITYNIHFNKDKSLIEMYNTQFNIDLSSVLGSLDSNPNQIVVNATNNLFKYTKKPSNNNGWYYNPIKEKRKRTTSINGKDTF